MVSLNVLAELSVSGTPYTAGFAFEYGGKKYLAVVGAPRPGRDSVVIACIDDRTVSAVTGIEDSECDIDGARIIPINGSKYVIEGNILKIRVLYGRNASNEFVCAEYSINLDSMSGSMSVVWTRPISDENNVLKSAVIDEFGEVLLPIPDSATVYILDLDTGEVKDSFDSGFDGYNPRASYKIKRIDSSYIALFGRHLQGDPFYRFDRSAKSLTEIPGSSVGNDSPHPAACEPYVSGGDVIYPATGATVEGSSPDLVWFDGSLNLLGKTDLSGLYANAHVYGMIIIGKLSNGNLACIMNVHDDHYNLATERRLIYAEISPSTWSIVGTTVLEETSSPLNLHLPFTNYYDRTGPVYVDVESKKVYAMLYSVGENLIRLDEYDISDLDVSEWNEWHALSTVPTAPTGWECLQTLMDLMNTLMYLVLFILVLSLLVSSMREAKRPAEE